MMKKLSIAIAMCAIAMTAHAAPNKAAAIAWANDYARAKDGIMDALVLRDAVGPTRNAMRRNLESLEQRAAKLWANEKHDCALAARILVNAFDETLPVMRGGGYIPTASLTRFAFHAGSAWADCGNALDALR
jgi:hypothetical protein